MINDPMGDLINEDACRSRLYEVVSLEPNGATLQAGDDELRLPLKTLPGGVEVGDVLRVTTTPGEGVTVDLMREASGRPQTSTVQASLMYVVLNAALAWFSEVLAAYPFQNLGSQAQPLVRYGVIALVAFFTLLVLQRWLLENPPELEELRNRYGRNDFLLWVLEQSPADHDDAAVTAFRYRWQHLKPRPVQTAVIGALVAGVAIAAGLPPVYGFVVLTLVAATFEIVRRRIFARWSAVHAEEAEALVWGEAFSPYRDRLTSARANLLSRQSPK